MTKVDTISVKKPVEDNSASLRFIKKKKPKLTKKKKTKTKANKGYWEVNPKRIVYGTLVGLFGILMFFLLGFSGAVFAYQGSYANKALFGTNLMGKSLEGRTEEEVAKVIGRELAALEISLEVEGEKSTAKPEELGINFLVPEIVKEAMTQNRSENYFRNFLKSAYSLVHKLDQNSASWVAEGLGYKVPEGIPLAHELNDEVLEQYTQGLAKKYEKKEKNASLVMKGTEVQVVPAVFGKQLVADAVRSQISSALEQGKINNIVIKTQEVDPEILEEDTQTSIRLAQNLIDQKILLSYDGKTFTPAKDTVGGWIVFKEKEGILKPEFDSGKIKSYVDWLAGENVNVAVVNEKVKIINGKDREVIREGSNGLAVDSKSLAAKITDSLNAERGYSGTIPTYVVKYKTEVNNVLVADWSKYIEVDISSQQMCAYLAGGEKINCWAITTGANGWNTPTGTFLISRKAGAGGQPGAYGGGVCMPNPPSTTPLCGINYVSTFTSQGHAIHEAWWRSSFGGQDYKWNGSHGCVNATYDIAKWIYNWAPIGTPVVVHY